jgi:hypothetical protein
MHESLASTLLPRASISFLIKLIHKIKALLKTEMNNEFVNRINEIINILFYISRNSIFIYLKTFKKKMSASTERIKVSTMQTLIVRQRIEVMLKSLS